MISLYGATGFIGKAFHNNYPEETIAIAREQREPESDNVLYMISTVDNYNVYKDPYLDINTNLNVLIQTLEKCKDKPDLVFNFVSSWFVYGKTNDLPATEETYCNPKGFYSITKRAAEQLLISYCETFGINYRIFRLCNVYGESDSKVSKKRNAMQYLINEIANDRDVNLYDGGENIRDYMYVGDVARAIYHCTKSAPINQIINIGSGRPTKIKDIMLYAKKKLNSKSNFNSIEAPDFHKVVQIKNMFLDNTKLKNLGFEEKFDLWSGVDMIIESMDGK